MKKEYRVRERFHDELLEDLLLARGVKGADAKGRFLAPDFERDSHDPFLLPDMERAVERVLSAIEHKEVVAVWSDYDADGLPAGVILSTFLREFGLTVEHYIPHRNAEGYGLNKGGIEELSQKNVALMITADCGTTDAEAIAFAKEKNIDTIVTDHHLVQEESLGQKILPEAVAFINPKRPDSCYPFDGLCGAGVAWKLVQGILQKKQPNGWAEGREKWFLDLVGIATLSDMVPLVDENRMLAYFGLMVLRRARRPGLAALLQLLKIKPRTLTEDDVGFMISPRINAASRMGSPQTAARLLCAQGDEAHALARELQALNDERKGAVAAIVKEANKRLKEQLTPSPIIVLGNPNWRPGILGLVASALVEAHQKPVFLWGREGGDALKGSCRSDGSLNVVECMQAANGAFDEFGGHHGAGGFSVAQEKVHELHKKLQAAYEALRTQEARAQTILIDRALPLSELPHALATLQKLAPFGIGNEKPLFMFPNVGVSRVRVFGKTNNHVELSIERDGARAAGIAFFSAPDSFSKPVSEGMRADVVGHIELDWKGSPRIRIVDVV